MSMLTDIFDKHKVIIKGVLAIIETCWAESTNGVDISKGEREVPLFTELQLVVDLSPQLAGLSMNQLSKLT